MTNLYLSHKLAFKFPHILPKKKHPITKTMNSTVETAENLLDNYWKEAEKHFPSPINLSWKYFPLRKVVSGKWYGNETLRKTSL